MITGQTLQDWGFKPARWFKDGIAEANRLRSGGADDAAIMAALRELLPPVATMRTQGLPIGVFLDGNGEAERANLAAVVAHMETLTRVPTIVSGAVMPDACPSGGAAGTIPVGGAVACEDAIHPGFHSADICCSVAVTVFGREGDPKRVLDAAEASTHFGPGGRPVRLPLPGSWDDAFDNRFLKGLETFAVSHFGSQGDGNHFAFVGRRKSDDRIALVTHHGSRGLGAQLYKRGVEAAKRHVALAAPSVPAHNAWIRASSDDGRAYWDALQAVRAWTKASHFAIHDLVVDAIGGVVADRFWNEHNFVFRRSDGLFYHGKGATPSWSGFSADDDGRTLIPLNMAEPILIVAHRDRKEALGFAPHGAGRNTSRTAHLRAHADRSPEELRTLVADGLDIRSFCGRPDYSELPSAYKDATAIRDQLQRHGLAEVVDEIVPYGSIMAGDWEADAPWRKKTKAVGIDEKASRNAGRGGSL